MGHRKNKSVSGRKKGKEVAVTFVLENDDSTSGDGEAKMFEKLLGNTDILSEIFSRLPPQTLFRLSCVSKSLYNFIGRSEFAALHSRNCKLVAGRTITGLFIQEIFCCYTSGSWYSGGEIQFNNTSEWEAGELPDPSLGFLKQKSRCDKVDIIDSCNGLLLCRSTTCGRNGKKLFVCNPLTRQKVALPHPKIPPSKSKSRKEEEGLCASTCALMADLDHHHLKYKVVCFFWPESTSPDANYSQLVIWFSEARQWVELGEKLPPFRSDPFQRPSISKVFFNGSLYWDCLEGHILVCPLNLKAGEPCYKLIDAPPAPKRRSLWKSEDKLHCYCHGFEDEFPEWTLSMNGECESKWELRQYSKTFRNLTYDVFGQVAKLDPDQWTGQRIQFKIISYAPQSKTFFLFIGKTVYTYHLDKRWLEYLGGFNPLVEYLGGFHPLEDTTFSHGGCRVFPYVHSLVRIQSAKTAGNRLGTSIAMSIQNRRVDHDADTGFEAKKVRGRHNKRTPKCQSYSLED